LPKGALAPKESSEPSVVALAILARDELGIRSRVQVSW
jgi:hypothetical protein